MKLNHEAEYICECENWEEPVLYPVAELIRCRECKWYDMSDPSGTVEPISYRCRRVNRLWREPDDHCKGAERKEE